MKLWLAILLFGILGHAHAEDVEFTSHDGYILDGTFENPPLAQKAVLFLHGSGNLDRDETLPAILSTDGQPIKLFKTLADELTAIGVASLRYDKRGFNEDATPQAYSAWQSATYENLLADADAGIQFLISKGFKSIVLVGHSEGTSLAIDLDIKSIHKDAIETLVLIGVVGGPMLESYHYQTVTRTAKQVFEQFDPLNRGYILEADVPPEFSASLPVAALDINANGKLEQTELTLALELQYNRFVYAVMTDTENKIIGGFPSLWWQRHFTEKPNSEKVALINSSVYILHGKKDEQVTYEHDAVPMCEALMAAGKSVTMKIYPEYGHGLSPNLADGTSTLGPIAADALEDFRNIFRLESPSKLP